MTYITASRCFQSSLLTVVCLTFGTTFFNVKSARSNSIENIIYADKVYADKVVDHKFFGKADHTDRWEVYGASAATGEANWTSEMTNKGSLGPWDKEIGVSLGRKGSLTVEFTENVLTGSGDDSLDLWIFEIGAIAEKISVEISTDNKIWHDIGIADRKDKQHDFGVGIDIDLPLKEKKVDAYNILFPYVRVTDTGDNKYGSFKAGADIDAIAAISSRPVTLGRPSPRSIVVSESVPEPSSIIGLLSLGIVGISTLVKPLLTCLFGKNGIGV